MTIISKDKEKIFFEFKFNRKIPSGKNQPSPIHAGKLFVDLVRLVKCKEKYNKTECFFVYVTDSVMTNYLQKDSNRLNDFFNII